MPLPILADDAIGIEMYELIRQLYPIHRSTTGHGVRKTLRILGELIPIEITEVQTGTSILDWTVPDEWNVTDAYIKDEAGTKVVDYAESNLHVVGYSRPIRSKLRWHDLAGRLWTIPERPGWIPFRTDIEGDWGFCLRHRDYERLEQHGVEIGPHPA